MKGLELTDMGDSAPRLLSRNNEAESIEATAKITGLGDSDDETLIGGRDDQTLPLKFKTNINKHQNERNKKNTN